MNSRPKLATLAWEMGRRNHKSPALQIVEEEASEKFTHFLKLVVGSVDAVHKRGASDRAPALCAHVQGGSEHVVVYFHCWYIQCCRSKNNFIPEVHLSIEILLVTTQAMLTAGLRWAPETGIKEWQRVSTPRPGEDKEIMW